MSSHSNKEVPTRNIALELIRVTEAAALASGRWLGKGDKNGADKAAVDAMRIVLNQLAIDGQVVIGEGEKDEAPMLFNGEKIGTGGPAFDIAVDPIDGTTLTAYGRDNALSVIALSEKGTMFDPGPIMYMNKIAVGPRAVGSIDLDASPLNEIQNLSYNQDTVKISLANNIVLPHDADRDSLNELQTLSITNKTITLSKGNSINLMDNDSLNEIQSLTLTQGTLKLSKANSIHLPDSSATNEFQSLSVSNDSVSISNGNAVYINTTRSLSFPEGTDGTPISIFGNTINYTVPAGKNFYITSCYQSLSGSNPGNSGLPVYPRLVVIRITPLAAREP